MASGPEERRKGRLHRTATLGLFAALVAAGAANVPPVTATEALPAPVDVPCKLLPCPAWQRHSGVADPVEYALRGSVMVVRTQDKAVYGISTETAATLWRWSPPASSQPQVLDLAETPSSGPAIVGVARLGSGASLSITALDPATGLELWSTYLPGASLLLAAVQLPDGILVLRSASPRDQWLRLDTVTGVVLAQGAFLPRGSWGELQHSTQGNVLWLLANGPGVRTCKVTGEECILSPHCAANVSNPDCIIPPNPGGPAGGFYTVGAGLAQYTYTQWLQPLATEVHGGLYVLGLDPTTLATRWAFEVPSAVGRTPIHERIEERDGSLLVAYADRVERRWASNGTLHWQVPMERAVAATSAGGTAYIVQADAQPSMDQERRQELHFLHAHDLSTGAPLRTMTLHGQHFEKVRVFHTADRIVVASALVAAKGFEEWRHYHDATLHVFDPEGQVRWIARQTLQEFRDDQMVEVREMNGTLISISRQYGGTSGGTALGVAAWRVEDLHATPGSDLAELVNGRQDVHVFLEPGLYHAAGTTRVKGLSVCVQQVRGSCPRVVQDAGQGISGPVSMLAHHGWKDAAILIGDGGWQIDARGHRVRIEAHIVGNAGLEVSASEARLERLAISTDAGAALALRAERAFVSGLLAGPVALRWERGNELSVTGAYLVGDERAIELDRLDGARATIQDSTLGAGSVHATKRVQGTTVETQRVNWVDNRCTAIEGRWHDEGDGNAFASRSTWPVTSCLAV